MWYIYIKMMNSHKSFHILRPAQNYHRSYIK